MGKATGYTLTQQEVNEFVYQSNQKRAYKFKPHNFQPLKGAGKNYCVNCGLVALRNDITNWCIKKG